MPNDLKVSKPDVEGSWPELYERRAKAKEMGGKERLKKLVAQSRLSVRERLDILLDPNSFHEIGIHAKSGLKELADRTPADGLVLGSGKIDGRTVFVAADDPSVLVGTRGLVAEKKLARLREMAIRDKRPFIMLSEAGAARLQESSGAISAALGDGFKQHTRMSGHIPQVSVIMGHSFGGPSFTAAMGDFTIKVSGTGFMGMSGPPLVKVGLNKDVTADQIGGDVMAMQTTGQADLIASDEREALLQVRRYLSYFPSSSSQLPPQAEPRAALCASDEGRRALSAFVPVNQRRAYNIQGLLELLVDEESLFIIRPKYGSCMLTAFARMDGQPVGIIANNPMQMGGAIDEKGAQKARKMIELCDAFHIPLVFFCDTPGFMVGPDIEKHRMVSHCARLINALVLASVPKVTVVLRKAVGMAYIAMCGRACEPDALVSWPGALFDVMGPEAGVMLIHGKEIEASEDPKVLKAKFLEELAKAASAFKAAELGIIDDVIDPVETRETILWGLTRADRAGTAEFKHRVEP